MTINDYAGKIKGIYPIILILIIISIIWAFIRLNSVELAHTPLMITYPGSTTTGAVLGASSDSLSRESGAVIGSLTGKKYYFPWCGIIKRVKPENQVQFASVEDARNAGYVAGKCKGLE